MKPLTMDFSMIFLVLVLLAIPTHQISDLVTKTCDKTAYKEFCKSELGSAPKTDVKNLAGLTTFALKMTSLKGVAIHKKIDQILKTTEDVFLQQCLQDCFEIYQDAVDQLEDSTAAVDAKAFADVKMWVSAAMTDAQSCEDSFKEKNGAKSPLTDSTTHFMQLCNVTLSITNLLAKSH